MMSVSNAETVESGRETFETESIDCLIIEPEEVSDYIDFISYINEENGEVPILLFADLDNQEEIKDALKAGATDYIFKSHQISMFERLAIRIETAVSARKKQTKNREAVSIMSEVYQKINRSDLSFNEKLQQLLEIGIDELGYPIGYATRIEGEIYEVTATAGNTEDIELPCDFCNTYSHLVVENESPFGIKNAPDNDSLVDHPMYTDIGFQSYIGAPIFVDDTIQGTLCFAGYDPRDADLIEAQKSALKKLSHWIGYEYKCHQRQKKLEQQVELFEEFTSIVTHDLKTPLNVAKGRIREAIEECDNPHLEPANEALDRMKSIIDDTLVMAKQGRAVDEKKPIEISSIIEICEPMFEEHDIEIRLIDDFVVHGDITKLRHVFENLFSNAVEHSHGSVIIRIGLIDNVYTSTRAPPSQTFGFYVEDDGPGIDESREESIFEPGETTREDGTGFGLAIVNEIVQAHNWNVTVTRSFDGGARFEFENVW